MNITGSKFAVGQYLIIWTDCDREGENIGYEIIEVCRTVKPNIKVFRAKFSEITYQSVVRAMQNLGPPNQNVSDAVCVRQELDLRIGAAFTRFQTLRLQQVFPESLGNVFLSPTPVQKLKNLPLFPFLLKGVR